MMTDVLTKEGIKYMIARLLENANEAVEESKANKEDQFAAGRRLAYYEMLDILKSELEIREQDLKELGLDINLENKIAERKKYHQSKTAGGFLMPIFKGRVYELHHKR